VGYGFITASVLLVNMMAPGEARRTPYVLRLNREKAEESQALLPSRERHPPRIHHEFIATVHREDVVERLLQAKPYSEGAEEDD